MEKYSIVIPFEGSEEEETLKQVVESNEGTTIAFGNTRNIDGLVLCQIAGDLEHLITLAGSFASIVSVIGLIDRKVTLFDSSNKIIKQNIKIKDLFNFLHRLKK